MLENCVSSVHCNTLNDVYDIRVLRCVVINRLVPLTYLTRKGVFIRYTYR